MIKDSTPVLVVPHNILNKTLLSIIKPLLSHLRRASKGGTSTCVVSFVTPEIFKSSVSLYATRVKPKLKTPRDEKHEKRLLNVRESA